MGIHRYEGNKKHSFREFRENCNWCQGYTSKGYNLVFPTEKNGIHNIETHFCSPKCYQESIEKSHTKKGYFEFVVSSFIDGGGLKEFENERRKQGKRWKEVERNRIEREKRRENLIMPIRIFFITLFTILIVMVLVKWIIS